MDFADSPWLWDSGTPQPSFERDFARDKELDRGGTGPAITFTRGTNATFFDASGVLQTASNDQPRFDHSSTGSSLGLLIEESRTNLLERSAEFDNAYWRKDKATITANSAVAPDGSTSADTLVETVENGGHFVARNISITSGTSYTLSVFAKAGTSSILMLTLGDGAFGTPVPRAWFNLSTGAVGSTVGSPSATSIQSVGNGWYRCSITKAATATGGAEFYISITDADGNAGAYTGSTSNNFLIWGAQLEAGAFPTSYIPTTTAAATRSADSAVVTPISSFYNQAEGTLFAEASRYQTTSNSKFLTFVRGSDQFFNVVLETNASAPTTSQRLVVADNTVAQASISISGAVAGTIYKMAGVYKADDFQFAQNGTLGAADTSGTVPTGITRMGVGTLTSDATNQFFLNGHIRKIAYYPRRLSNTLLQQLTT